MKNFLVAFLVFIVWSFFGLWLYSWLEPSQNPIVAQNENAPNVLDKIDASAEENVLDIAPEAFINGELIDSTSNASTETVIKTENTAKGLKAITEEGDVVFLFSEGFEIKKNSAELVAAESIVDFKYKINTFLIEHPDKEVHIISLYSATENNESPNLGVQRGKAVKKILVETGIPAEKIVIKSMIKEIDFTEDNKLYNSINFAFRPLDQERIDAIIPEMPEAILVYPKYNGTRILEDKKLKNLLELVLETMDNNPDVSIEVIGHTDGIGAASENYHLGLKYARQVRWYLVRKGGVDKNRIKATSRGESESIDTNNTPRGRKINQRIEVVFY